MPAATREQVGDEFADEQGRSVVIAFDEGQEEPDVSECPLPEGPPPTTVLATTTTVPQVTLPPTR